MPNTGLKIDIINEAYALIRISGITRIPTPEELEKALDRLESMAEEFFGRNIDTNYAFEDEPDSNTPHTMKRKYWYGFETNLSIRLLADFGKPASPELLKMAQAGYSFLSSDTAPMKQTPYPSRMPRGSGSTLRYNRWQRFYRPVTTAPLSAETNQMFIDDVSNFVEHFDSFLNLGETISSYTIEADEGITVTSSSLSSPDVNYRITADGNTEDSEPLLRVKIVATTSAGRIETRFVNFSLSESTI